MQRLVTTKSCRKFANRPVWVALPQGKIACPSHRWIQSSGSYQHMSRFQRKNPVSQAGYHIWRLPQVRICRQVLSQLAQSWMILCRLADCRLILPSFAACYAYANKLFLAWLVSSVRECLCFCGRWPIDLVPYLCIVLFLCPSNPLARVAIDFSCSVYSPLLLREICLVIHSARFLPANLGSR